MSRWRLWLLPALLAAAQLAYSLGLGRTGDPVALVVTAIVTVALATRVRHPLPAVVAVAVAVDVGNLLRPDQVAFVPADTLLIVSLADMFLLFGVAVRADRNVTVAALAIIVGGLTAGSVVQYGLTADVLYEAAADLVVYSLIAAAGRLRRRWRADRAEAARRLEEARAAEREAAVAERRRLARELHDVSAHHLTSIVVNASAAAMLGDQRPELRDEAVAFAARTGRETLTALRELVAVLPSAADGDKVPDLADLVDDFRQLGQPVTLDIRGEGGPAVADAVHGIVREALTNTLRYSAGAQVRVAVDHEAAAGTVVVVENEPAGASTAANVGGGRGIAGMRDRAVALGGTLAAGPRPGGGWLVRAEVPSGRTPKRSLVGSRVVFDAGLVLFCLLVPLTEVVVAMEEEGLRGGPAVVITLVLLAHTVPLMWRRRAPWLVLASTMVTMWLSLLVVVTQVVTAGESAFMFSIATQWSAVYAVTAYGVRPKLTWLAALAATASDALIVVVLVLRDPPQTSPPIAVAFTVVTVAALAGTLLILPAAASWLAGFLVRRRRTLRSEREENAVAGVAAQAEEVARTERARIAAGLRDAVLHHAAEVPQAADRADLTAVVTNARAALTAMRGLLDSLTLLSPGEVPSSPSV